MNTRIEPIELTDDELKAVAGGLNVSNSTVNNSFNDVTDASGNTNSFNNITISGA
jgi:hypothetical protein